MTITLVGGLLLILFIIIIIFAAGRVRQFEGENVRGEDMIKTIYIYVVLLATLMMTIGGGVASFMALADIVSPPAYYQSFEDYKRMPERVPDSKLPAMTPQELQKSYDQLLLQEKQRTRDRAVNSLLKSFGWIVIPFPIFLFYQRKLKHD